MLSAYPACFIKSPGDDGYSVVFPDLNDLATCGKDLEEAFSMAVDCLAGYLYTNQQEGGTPAAAPSPLGSIDANAVARKLGEDTPVEAFTNMVTVDVGEYAKVHFEKYVRKNVTIPAWMNEAAMAQRINFSQLLQEALRKRLSLPNLPQ